MFSIYGLSTPERMYWLFVAGIFGAAMGSFLNCAAWRIVKGESFLTGRSRCPECGHVLGAADLVPILSWLFLRGRCRYCGSRVSPRYVLAECLFSAVTVLCLLRFDLTFVCLRNYVFLSCLFCLSLTDLQDFLIPDGCLILPALAWLATLPLIRRPGALWNVLAALIYGAATFLLSLVMDRILKKDSLGGGDIKLFALMGLYLGAVGSLFALPLSCAIGLLFALGAKVGRGQPFPFGPAISAASAVMLLYGEPLTEWYLSLLKV